MATSTMLQLGSVNDESESTALVEQGLRVKASRNVHA